VTRAGGRRTRLRPNSPEAARDVFRAARYIRAVLSKEMPTKKSTLLAAAEAFDDSLARFAALAEALRKGPLESRRGLERASEALREIASCEEDLQAHAQTLMAALGASRDAQQAQSDAVRARALEIQQRSEEYAAIMGRFEAIGKEAAGLNALAQSLAGRRRSAETALREDDLASLLSDLDELQQRMTAVATTSGALATDARQASFEEPSREVKSLRQQLLAARNKIGLLKEALGKTGPRA
jgi:cytochrome c556